MLRLGAVSASTWANALALVGIDEQVARELHDAVGSAGMMAFDGERRRVARGGSPLQQIVVIDPERPGEQIDLPPQLLFQLIL